MEDGEDVGVYGVKLFLNGAWQTIVIDDSFPCVRDAATSYREPLFAGATFHTMHTAQYTVRNTPISGRIAW